jgi:hypothetical protein
MSDPIYTPTESPPVTPTSSQPGGTVQAAKQDLRAAAAEARAAASQAAGTVKQEAASAAQTVKQEAQGVVQAVQQRAEGAVEEGKRLGVEQAEGIARAVHRAASELEDTNPQLASIVHDAAGTIDRMTRGLRESGPSDMLQGVTDFARRNPLAFFGASVVAGFAIARFARASAPRTYAGADDYGAYGEAGAEYASYPDPAYTATPSDMPGAGYVSGASGSFSGDATGVSGSDMGHGTTGTAASGGVAQGSTTTGLGTGHETASGAPGWVAGEDGTARPSTLASASLGGAAARQTPGQSQFDRDESAGSKS